MSTAVRSLIARRRLPGWGIEHGSANGIQQVGIRNGPQQEFRALPLRLTFQHRVGKVTRDDRGHRWVIGAPAKNQVQTVVGAEAHTGNQHIRRIDRELVLGFVKTGGCRHAIASRTEKRDGGPQVLRIDVDHEHRTLELHICLPGSKCTNLRCMTQTILTTS